MYTHFLQWSNVVINHLPQRYVKEARQKSPEMPLKCNNSYQPKPLFLHYNKYKAILFLWVLTLWLIGRVKLWFVFVEISTPIGHFFDWIWLGLSKVSRKWMQVNAMSSEVIETCSCPGAAALTGAQLGLISGGNGSYMMEKTENER